MKWICDVCGLVLDKKPKRCPRCNAPGSSYIPYVKREELLKKLKGRADLLLINGSGHKAHNTSFLLGIAEKVAKRMKVNYKLLNLKDYNLEHCWCCYSIEQEMCDLPCKNQADDMHFFHDLVLNCKAMIIATPINWNNLTSRLKVFLDRLTCIQNQTLLYGKMPCANKIMGIIVDGHEDGAYRVSAHIWDVLRDTGFVLAPYGVAYRTHGAPYPSQSDNAFFKRDASVKRDIENITENVIRMMRLNLPKRLPKVKPSCM